jgi:hypothetical protein
MAAEGILQVVLEPNPPDGSVHIDVGAAIGQVRVGRPAISPKTFQSWTVTFEDLSPHGCGKIVQGIGAEVPPEVRIRRHAAVLAPVFHAEIQAVPGRIMDVADAGPRLENHCLAAGLLRALRNSLPQAEVHEEEAQVLVELESGIHVRPDFFPVEREFGGVLGAPEALPAEPSPRGEEHLQRFRLRSV